MKTKFRPVPDLTPEQLSALQSKTTSVGAKPPDLTPEQIQEAQSQQSPGFWGKLPSNIRAGLMGIGHQSGALGVAGIKSLEDLGQKIKEARDSSLFMRDPTLVEEDTPYSEKAHNFFEDVFPPDYARLYGPEHPTLLDKMIQGAITYAPELTAGTAIARSAIPLVSRHAASAPLRAADRLAAERSIGQVNVPEHLIEDARQYLPNTEAYRRTINEALEGDFNALFRLQSDLGQISRQMARNPFSASERAMGRAGHQVRQELLGEKAAELRRMGHQDIAELQQLGRDQYRRYMRMRPYVRTGVALGLAQIPEIPSYLKRLLFHD